MLKPKLYYHKDSQTYRYGTSYYQNGNHAVSDFPLPTSVIVFLILIVLAVGVYFLYQSGIYLDLGGVKACLVAAQC